MKLDKTGIETRLNARGEVISYEVRAQLKSGKPRRKRFPAGASWIEMASWRLEAIKALQAAASGGRGSFDADVQVYLREADISDVNRGRRTQQLAWWSAQPAALDGPVLSVADVLAGKRIPGAVTIGQSPRRELKARRVRQILAAAFKPTDRTNHPTEFGGTSNHYRTALSHLYDVLDMDDDDATKPTDKVPPRQPTPAARLGQDMRIVQRILDAMARPHSRVSLGELRAAVLAWCPLTPIQLQRMTPADFYDLPHATREDMIAGKIAIMRPPRFKGTQKHPQAPTLQPLTPRGVAAMRALVARPGAFTFNRSALCRRFERACARAQKALAAEGIRVDLTSTRASGGRRMSTAPLYVLKHSLTATMAIAAPGRVDARTGEIVIPDGVKRTLGHATPQITRVYALAAIDPIRAEVSAATARYLDWLFTQPLGGNTGGTSRVEKERKGEFPRDLRHGGNSPQPLISSHNLS